METLIAYKGDKELKKKFVAQIEKHRKADQIVQGTYGRENGTWKGCAVACSLRSLAELEGEPLKTEYSNHKEYETRLGIPEWLARLEDTIFEGLPKKDAMKWPTAFSEAIPVGVNLEPVKWKFGVYLMKENIDRVMKLKISDELKSQVVDAIQKVMAVHTEAIRTGKWDESAAWSARSAAWSARSAVAAAAESAWSAARSAAWSAAESAAESAAWSARSAAWSARSAAWSAAAYVKHSKELLKLLAAQDK